MLPVLNENEEHIEYLESDQLPDIHRLFHVIYATYCVVSEDIDPSGSSTIRRMFLSPTTPCIKPECGSWIAKITRNFQHLRPMNNNLVDVFALLIVVALSRQ